MNTKALAAEFIGTFTLVTATCGTALFSAPAAGPAGLIAVAFAIGFSVLMMGYAVGHISGGHFNPAVTLGLVAGGRFDMGNAVSYIIAQVLGGLLAALIFSTILGGAPSGAGIPKWNDFTAISNTYGGAKGFTMGAAFLTEVVVTALLLIVIMGATSKKAPAGFAPIAIGVALFVLHLVATNASINPARSTAPAVLAGGVALSQLWVFWVAPIIGGVIGGILSRWIQEE